MLREGAPDRRHCRGARRARTVLRQRDRAAEDLRRPGRDRHREHAAVRGGAGAHARASESRSNTRPRPAMCSNVISRSPTELQPVLDAIAETAAGFAMPMTLSVFQASTARTSCWSRSIGELAEIVSSCGGRLSRARTRHRGRASSTEQTIQSRTCCGADPEYPDVERGQLASAIARRSRCRCCRTGEPLGVNRLHRRTEVRPVHRAPGRAAEDLRRPGRHRHREHAAVRGRSRRASASCTESLEYQTATSEVLNVISRSTSNIQPVFDTIVGPRARLCEPADGTYYAVRWRQAVIAAATATIEPPVADDQAPVIANTPRLRSGTLSLGAGNTGQEDAPYSRCTCAGSAGLPSRSAQAAGGFRVGHCACHLQRGDRIGTIITDPPLHRALQLRQATRSLVETFADQAVIAIENARCSRRCKRARKSLQRGRGARDREPAQVAVRRQHEP